MGWIIQKKERMLQIGGRREERGNGQKRLLNERERKRRERERPNLSLSLSIFLAGWLQIFSRRKTETFRVCLD